MKEFFKLDCLKKNPVPQIIDYNGESIQSLCWISKWALFNAFPNGKQYFQIDASFYALYPYVYCVPLMVVNNASLPLGLVLGPSEHHNLFLVFFNLLENFNISFHCKI